MERTCIACGAKGDKRSLSRFVWRQNGPQEDERQIEPGRGAYCCRRQSCRQTFFKAVGKWKRAFRLR